MKGLLWYVYNIVCACWRFNLRDMADRPGQTTLKRAAYRMVITVETLLEALFLAVVVATVGVAAVAVLPLRWVVLEVQDTWSES